MPTIKQLPIIINKPGKYKIVGSHKIKNNVSAIHINSNDVTLEFDGTITGPGKEHSAGCCAITVASKNNIVIKNAKVKNYAHGICLSSVDDVKLTGCSIVNCNVGIRVSESERCVIKQNVTSSCIYGIDLHLVTDCTITKNRISTNDVGLFISRSSNNHFKDNTCNKNKKSVIFSVHDFNDFDNEFVNDTVNGKPIVIIKDQNNVKLTNNSAFICCINSNVTAVNQKISNVSHGIIAINSTVNVTSSTITETSYGLYAINSKITLNRCKFNNNGVAIFEHENTGTYDNVNFTDNRKDSVVI